MLLPRSTYSCDFVQICSALRNAPRHSDITPGQPCRFEQKRHQEPGAHAKNTQSLERYSRRKVRESFKFRVTLVRSAEQGWVLKIGEASLLHRRFCMIAPPFELMFFRRSNTDCAKHATPASGRDSSMRVCHLTSRESKGQATTSK